MELKLAFIGMGNVGRAFARLLQARRDELARHHGLGWVVTAIGTARHGSLISETGLDLAGAVQRIESVQSISAL